MLTCIMILNQFIPRMLVNIAFSLLILLLVATVISCSKDDDSASKDFLLKEAGQPTLLIKKLIYSDEETKNIARKELDVLDDSSKTKLIPELLIALRYMKSEDKNAVVYRYRAAATLGMLGPLAKETMPDLIHTVKNDGADVVRSHAIAALAKVGAESEKIISLLLEVCKDSRNRSDAVNAITGFGEKAVPALIEALKSDNKNLQFCSTRALSEMGPAAKEASPVLLQALKSADDNRLKDVISDAIKRIGPPTAEETATLVQDIKNSDNNMRFSAIRALSIKGKEAVTASIKLLTDRDQDVRFWAAYILARNKSTAKEATEALKINQQDVDICVRGNIIWALREIEPSAIISNDITDDELAAIDKMIKLEPKDDDILIHTISRLDKLASQFPSSHKLDQAYFLSGLAKIAIGSLIGSSINKNPHMQEYVEKHKDDYVLFLGVMYTGGDFKKLIEKFPTSPLAGEAAYLMALEHTKVGECEGDMGCELNSSIGVYLSFLQNYPTHPKTATVIENIKKVLQVITHDPLRGGLWEIFNIQESTSLLNKYHDVIKTIPDQELRGNALYHLARAFISIGQYNLAERTYNDLESNYPKYQNAKTRAAYLLFDFSEKVPQRKSFSPEELSQQTIPFRSSSVNTRLEALEKITRFDINDRPMLFSLLLVIGNLSENDSSPSVRKRAIEVIGELAPKTSFFRSAVGYCLLHEKNKQNQYYCAELGIQHPELKFTEFYTFNRDRIDAIITETTGSTALIDNMISERRGRLMQQARESLQEAKKQAEGFNMGKFEEDMAQSENVQIIKMFGTEYILIKKRIKPEIVIPLYLLVMLLCGIYCFRIAEQRNADKRFWMIVGALTAPLSLFFIFIIPRKNS